MGTIGVVHRYVEKRDGALYQRCYECREILISNEFYRDRSASYGIKGTCKKCMKKKRLSESNKERRENDLLKKRIFYRNNKKKWHKYKNTSRKKSKNEIKNPTEIKKEKARRTLRHAVRDGCVIKPKYCSRCLRPFPRRLIHGHHDDYDKPLLVVWLCSPCHGEKHREGSNE